MKTIIDLTPQLFADLANKGMTLPEIAKEFNTTWSKVQYRRRKWGLPILKNRKAEAQEHPRWKGGRSVEKRSGYVRIYAPERARYGKYIYEHTLKAEDKIGRRLLKTENVHHVDGDKTNNDITNLVIVTDSHHRRLHHQLESFGMELVRRGDIIFNGIEYVWKSK